MISEAQQTQLVQMTVGLFNAAPGVTYMNDFAKVSTRVVMWQAWQRGW